MAFSMKTWIDRLSEFPNRRRLDSTGIANTYDVTRSEGTVTTEGDKFNAATMNDLEQRIADGFAATVPTTRTVNGHALNANITITKADTGLGNVDNTADANKTVHDTNTITSSIILVSGGTSPSVTLAAGKLWAGY